MTPIAESEAGTAGVDEAGRGPLAGPVVAAAVLLDPGRPVPGLRDSKRLGPARRVELAALVRAGALAWATAHATAQEVDRMNILEATLATMARAVGKLRPVPQRILVDGNRCPAVDMPAAAIVGGDRREAAIAAASILAKVERDAYMVAQARIHPGYGFERHKGYGTRAHLEALARLGPCSLHRRSFAPVRDVQPDGGGECLARMHDGSPRR